MEKFSPAFDQEDSFEDTQSLLDHERPRVKTQRRRPLSFVCMVLNYITLVLNITLALYNSLHWYLQLRSDAKLGSSGVYVLPEIIFHTNEFQQSLLVTRLS